MINSTENLFCTCLFLKLINCLDSIISCRLHALRLLDIASWRFFSSPSRFISQNDLKNCTCHFIEECIYIVTSFRQIKEVIVQQIFELNLDDFSKNKFYWKSYSMRFWPFQKEMFSFSIVQASKYNYSPFRNFREISV